MSVLSAGGDAGNGGNVLINGGNSDGGNGGSIFMVGFHIWVGN